MTKSINMIILSQPASIADISEYIRHNTPQQRPQLANISIQLHKLYYII